MSQYCKHIPNAAILPWGCTIELDLLGLPVAPRIHHNTMTCICTGNQDTLLLKHLEQWRTGAAELLQIDPKCAAVVIIRLIDKWQLGTTGWLDALGLNDQEQTQEWKAELVRKAIPNNPLANAKITKKKPKRNIKVELQGQPTTTPDRDARWCEDATDGFFGN